MAQNNLNGNWEGLLDQMGITDPAARQQWQMLAGMINANQTNPQTVNEDVARRRQQARKKLHYLQQEHEMLAARNDDLAAALGACPECWGEFRGCPRCHGRGRPGQYPPAQDLFNEYVLPVLERLGLVRADTVQPGPQKEG